MPYEEVYEVLFTEPAARDRDRLDPVCRASFDKAVALLARDPYTEHSRPVGPGEQDREIRLTSQIVAEYMVSRGRLLLVVLRIFDDADILLVED
ncbi:type II toxin-antitoxin system RelE/ParE family toxin [Streptomyces sp. NPDC053474]|uniref:type II toxin-antitoxin system RelE/ParE family toxin n=1 Tax=Streptomyces sp. NPDC053474 TaxID=3365704 RepID=UPI0037D98719